MRVYKIILILLSLVLISIPVYADCTMDEDCPFLHVCDKEPGEEYGDCKKSLGAPAESPQECAQYYHGEPLGIAYNAQYGHNICWRNGCGPVDGWCDPTRDNCDCEPACCGEEVPEDKCDFTGARCDGNQVVRCSDIDYDGAKEQYVVEDCRSKGMVCESGSCIKEDCDECDSYGYVCKGNTLYHCSRDSNGCLTLSYVERCDSDYEVCDGNRGNCRSTKQTCPYECCSGDNRYFSKSCDNSNEECQYHTCVSNREPCPYECCPQGTYDAKVCSSGYTCKDNECVKIKKTCPYECCKTTDTKFYSKSCSSGYKCVSYRCEKICTDECDFSGTQCYEGDVYGCYDIDKDGCKELNLIMDCGDDKTCSNEKCVRITATATKTPSMDTNTQEDIGLKGKREIQTFESIPSLTVANK